jgi:hypothetical protein
MAILAVKNTVFDVLIGLFTVYGWVGKKVQYVAAYCGEFC